MKIYDKEVLNSHGGKRRVLMALNLKEAKLLLGVIERVKMHLPKIIENESDYSRLLNMTRSLSKYIKLRNQEYMLN